MGAFCNTFDICEVIISLENLFLLVFFWVSTLDQFYCNWTSYIGSIAVK